MTDDQKEQAFTALRNAMPRAGVSVRESDVFAEVDDVAVTVGYHPDGGWWADLRLAAMEGAHRKAVHVAYEYGNPDNALGAIRAGWERSVDDWMPEVASHIQKSWVEVKGQSVTALHEAMPRAGVGYENSAVFALLDGVTVRLSRGPDGVWAGMALLDGTPHWAGRMVAYPVRRDTPADVLRGLLELAAEHAKHYLVDVAKDAARVVRAFGEGSRYT